MNNATSNKNDRLYQRTIYNHIQCGKTHLVLDLIEKEYSKYFDYIIIICQTLRCDKTYPAEDWINHYDKVWLIEPKDKLY